MAIIQETVCFENTSSLEDPIFSGPAGKMSLRQAIILGMGCIPLLLYSLSTFDFMLLPLIIIPLIIGLPRPKILSMDQLVMSLILFYINGPSIKSKDKTRKKPNKVNASNRRQSRFLGTDMLRLKDNTKKKTVQIKKFTISDFKKPINLKLDLHKPNGESFTNHFVEIYLDEKRVGAMTTDVSGQIVATFIPETPGDRRLKIYADKYDEPVIDEIVSFCSK